MPRRLRDSPYWRTRSPYCFIHPEDSDQGFDSCDTSSDDGENEADDEASDGDDDEQNVTESEDKHVTTVVPAPSALAHFTSSKSVGGTVNWTPVSSPSPPFPPNPYTDDVEQHRQYTSSFNMPYIGDIAPIGMHNMATQGLQVSPVTTPLSSPKRRRKASSGEVGATEDWRSEMTVAH